MVRKSFSILVLTFAAAVWCNAQEQPKQIPDCGVRPKIEGNNPACFKPVVYGNEDDGFPKKMKIRGVVTRVTMTHIACGVLCLWGTAEIKLLEKPKGYDHDFMSQFFVLAETRKITLVKLSSRKLESRMNADL